MTTKSLIDPNATEALSEAVRTLQATAFDIDGRISNVGPSTALIPEERLPAVIGHLEKSLTPIGRGSRSDFWVLAVISAYPYLPASFSKEGYLIAVGSVFAELPDDIARETVDLVTRKVKFIPTRAEIAEVADELVRKRRAALIRARRMEDEHRRRKAEAEESERIARDKAEFLANGGAEKIKEMVRNALQKMAVFVVLAIPLSGCAYSEIMQVQETVNSARYVKDPEGRTGIDYHGFEDFMENGGDCENFAAAKCEALTKQGHTCEIVAGESKQGIHALALVNGEYWLDQRRKYARSTKKPEDFHPIAKWGANGWEPFPQRHEKGL